MTRSILPASLLLALVVGCQSGGGARVVNETQSITTVNSIDIQDWNAAANQLSLELLASGVFERAPRQPSVLAISRFINNTTEQVDMDLLNKTVRINLLNSGKVQTSTVMGLGGVGSDPLAQELAAERAILNRGQEAAAGANPDYTLTGKIIQVQSRAGSVRQSVFAFQLALTDIRSGTAVWEGEKQIIKQGRRASVGF
jgi:uncharacterized protein (TIGR02722 family)